MTDFMYPNTYRARRHGKRSAFDAWQRQALADLFATPTPPPRAKVNEAALAILREDPTAQLTVDDALALAREALKAARNA